ncbi:molecular chaperone DnaJ [Actinorugispora endophytica]|uniref:Protein kinase domain-containing protein n=1 Tax=Actinorugispora endophytica TaxID=1605990 RepID=A0A4V3D736_9ACTN|nr:molecular chaperone DnaJ [Actinorugispora endophytica]TDQ46347.1 hypothetical protein EV190_12534 [Actinorugispora endophytica]
MSADFDRAEHRVLAASGPAELFGPAPEGGAAPTDEAARTWRSLARVLHPDRAREDERARALAAYSRLAAHWSAHRRTEAETGGVTVTTRRRVYRVGALIARGDIANVYRAVWHEDGRDHDAVVKMPRSVADNDLMAAEAESLAVLAEHGRPDLAAYAPRLVEAARHRDAATGAVRDVTVLEPLRGFHTLADVAAAHPGGLDPRDAAWMWRRLLVAVGNAHAAGLVHGAVVAANVLVHPGKHGLVLADWCYAVPEGQRVRAVVEAYEDDYAPEIPQGGAATPATDIHMATRTMARLIGPRMPAPMAAFARGCALEAPSMRPKDAWALLGEFDGLLERLWGPRSFRPFTMPTDPAY